MKIKLPFTAQIIVAMVLAIVVGLVLQFCGHADWASRFIAPFGMVFLNLIKFIVCPLVLFSVMSGVVSMDDVKKVGRLGLKTVLIFFVTTLVAISFSLVVGLLLKGVFPVLSHPATQVVNTTAASAVHDISLAEIFTSIFPSNFAMPFVEANMLQIIVMALFFAISVIIIGGEIGAKLTAGIRLMDSLCVTTLATIMRLSPYGVFCLMCPTVATNGVTVLGSLAAVIAVMYVCYAAHLIIFDPLFVTLFAGVSPKRFLREMMPAIVFSFSSSSSVGTLPINFKCVKRLGVSDEIASFVLPLGATINMNGTVIYHGICTVFIASCYGISLNFGQIVSIVVTSTLASVGTAGVPGAGIVMLAMVLSAAGLPLDGIALVAGVDRIFDMGRTVLNITGDATAAVVISAQRKS